METNEVIVVQGKKPRSSIPTKLNGKTYPCKGCAAERQRGLCIALPNCIEPYVHYVKV